MVFLTFAYSLRAKILLMLAARVHEFAPEVSRSQFFFLLPGTVRRCCGKEAAERQIEGRTAVGG